MQDAVTSANLLAQEWSARTGVNLWTVELVTVPFTQTNGVWDATYAIPANVVSILDLYVSTVTGGEQIDRYILPISRTEYASFADKAQSGFPTSYWFDRLLAPTITFWPVPNGQPTSFSYYAFTQIQDMALNNGQTLQMNTYALKAFGLGLAHELSVAWAPEREMMLDRLAKEAYAIFADQNVEKSQFYISPTLSGYWRT